MIDNFSPLILLIPELPGVTRRGPRNRIWKDPSFWKGFLLGTGKGKDKRVTVRLLEGFFIGYGKGKR